MSARSAVHVQPEEAAGDELGATGRGSTGRPGAPSIRAARDMAGSQRSAGPPHAGAGRRSRPPGSPARDSSGMARRPRTRPAPSGHERPAMGRRQHPGVNDRDSPRRQDHHPTPRQGADDHRRGRLGVARAHHHPRADRDRREARIAGRQDHPLGLALRPRVGRLHAAEVPRRELVGRPVRRSGRQGVQGRRVDEPLDPGSRRLGQQPGRRVDVDRPAGTAGSRPRQTQLAAWITPRTSASARRRTSASRRSPTSQSIGGSPGSIEGGRRVRPRTRCPAPASSRAMCPPTKPPAPVTSTGQSDGSGSRPSHGTRGASSAAGVSTVACRSFIAHRDGARWDRAATGRGRSAIASGPGPGSSSGWPRSAAPGWA